MSVLGIDVGTTGCKAAVYNARGECLARAYREYPTLHPQPGWAELDSALVWQRVQAVIAEAARAAAGDPVTALCVSSMGEAMTPVTADRRILGNAILCSDIRGTEYADALAGDPGQESFYAINPNILGPAYSLPKLAWVRDHQPDLYRQADRFLLWGDLVGFLLGGEPTTSYALANRTLLFDIHREQWSRELLQRTGIDGSKLPTVAPSGSDAGCVSDAIASELGLAKGARIIVGGHDQCCNALGAGVLQAGRAVCGIGTFECFAPAFGMPAEPHRLLRYGLNIEHHVVPGLYLTFAYNQSGSLVRWFRDTFARAEAALETSQSVYDRLNAEMPAEITDIIVLPWFEPTGPPDFLTNVSGAVLGLRTSTSRGEILKAIMESVTMYFVPLLRALDELGLGASEYVATGGGARSDAWLQIKADILGVPFVRPSDTEGSALGAAILAGTATGVWGSLEEAVGLLVRRDRVFEPDPCRHERYREKVARFLELASALRPHLAPS